MQLSDDREEHAHPDASFACKPILSHGRWLLQCDDSLWIRNAQIKVVWQNDTGATRETVVRTNAEGRFVAGETFNAWGHGVSGESACASNWRSGAYASIYVRFQDPRLKVLYTGHGDFGAEESDPVWFPIFHSASLHYALTGEIYGGSEGLRFDLGYAWDLNSWVPGATGRVSDEDVPFGNNLSKGYYLNSPFVINYLLEKTYIYDRICEEGYLEDIELEHLSADEIDCSLYASEELCLEDYKEDVARYCEEYASVCDKGSTEYDSDRCELLRRCPFTWYHDEVKGGECSDELIPFKADETLWWHASIWAVYQRIFDYFHG